MANDTDPFPGPIVRLADRDVIYQVIWCSSVFCVLVAILDEPANLLAKGQADAFRSRGMLYSISVTTFYGFVVALYMALYLGGTGWHMELVKWHVAKLTEVSVSTATAKSAGQERWTRQNHQIVPWVIIGMQAAWLAHTVLIGLLICRPVQKNWDPTVQGTCGNRIAGYTSASVVNDVVIDVLMLILPRPMVFNLWVKSWLQGRPLQRLRHRDRHGCLFGRSALLTQHDGLRTSATLLPTRWSGRLRRTVSSYILVVSSALLRSARSSKVVPLGK